MVTPQLLVGGFSHPVWQAVVHRAQRSEAQNETDAKMSVARQKNPQQVRRGGARKKIMRPGRKG